MRSETEFERRRQMVRERMAAETEGLPHCVALALLPCPTLHPSSIHGAKPRSQARTEPGNKPPSG